MDEYDISRMAKLHIRRRRRLSAGQLAKLTGEPKARCKLVLENLAYHNEVVASGRSYIPFRY
jgi:hypothetical protein